MICLNCKKQIPDNSASCPYCGNQIIHKEQLSEEIKFRRYQRWIFYVIISIVFLGMIGIIVKIYNANSANQLRLAGLDQELTNSRGELNKATSSLAEKEQAMADQARQLQESDANLKKVQEDLTKKTDAYKKVLDEKMAASTQKKDCEFSLNSADANIYSLIIKLGVGISNADISRIRIADSNLNVGKDTDSDGLSDEVEAALATNPDKPDTDGDGYDDKSEVLGGYNPLGAGTWDINQAIVARSKGRILLQVESHGEAWYVSPSDGKRYFLGSPADAFRVMRDLDYWTKDWVKDHPTTTDDAAVDTSSTEILSSTLPEKTADQVVTSNLTATSSENK